MLQSRTSSYENELYRPSGKRRRGGACLCPGLCSGSYPQQRYGDDVLFLGVAGQDDVSAMDAFVDELGLDGFDHIADRAGQLWIQFDVSAQPTYVFINQDGSYTRQVGAIDGVTFDNEIEALLDSVDPVE